MTIVGVVGATKHHGLDRPARAEMYLPHAQMEYGKAIGVWRSVILVLRTTGQPADSARLARQELAAVDPDIPVSEVRTMDEVLGASVSRARFSTALVGAFSVVALLLALIGVYGVMSYSVLRRTREFGIRAALGAQERDIVGLVLRQAMTLALAGVGVGIACAIIATRALESQLFGIRPTDPLTYGTVGLVVVATALLAGYLPARRAARVGPLVGIRSE